MAMYCTAIFMGSFEEEKEIEEAECEEEGGGGGDEGKTEEE